VMAEEVILAAGGVVVRHGANGHEVLILHKRCPSEWRLPKGKIKDGERAEEAALREVQEETGLRCEVLSRLGETEHLFPEPQTGSTRRKRTTYYLMRAISGPLRADWPTFDAVCWFPVRNALRYLTFHSERQMVRKALDALSSPLRQEKGFL
jgi:8-oxo-dGTP pyrophosphatase MutT (NUDIX family)